MKTPSRLSLFFSLLVAISSGLVAAEVAKPNIVFIYADDLGFGDLAGHGHPRIQTPNLDRLAREGTDFWSFTVVSPVCSPSRTGIITGQFPSRWGVHQHFASHEQNVARTMPDWLDPKAPLLPRVMKEAGYRTAHYGKWHLSGDAIEGAPFPAAYGYDDAKVWTGPGPHVFEGTNIKFPTGGAPADDKEAASWISVAATDHAVKFIRDAKGAPFYLNLWLHETHQLVSATDDDIKPYLDVAEPQRTYYAAVTRADRQVGRILGALDELGLAQNTIVIFSSDNGPENAQPKPTDKLYHSVGTTGGLRGRKRSLLMGGVNVAFLVRWPGVVPNGRVDKETALAGVDLFPTLLAATGATAPDGYVSDGENMLPALKGQPQRRTKPVFWWWQGKHAGDDWPAFAMREGPWVLVLDETKQKAELHDVVADRAQSKNVVAEQPERVARMRGEIEKWFAMLPKTIDPCCSRKLPRRPAAAKKAVAPASGATLTADRTRAFGKWDKDRDGAVTREEYRNGLAKKGDAENRFKNVDKDNDDQLTREEFIGPTEKQSPSE